ncbi:hypothetical protein PG997_007460 [Apiospora hydei]|uniref:Uncharacterized protein n=1 Tax=Apiospora hydei TaxID=1337664 RepID=A0ABR1W9B8_9PEZI
MYISSHPSRLGRCGSRGTAIAYIHLGIEKNFGSDATESMSIEDPSCPRIRAVYAAMKAWDLSFDEAIRACGCYSMSKEDSETAVDDDDIMMETHDGWKRV